MSLDSNLLQGYLLYYPVLQGYLLYYPLLNLLPALLSFAQLVTCFTTLCSIGYLLYYPVLNWLPALLPCAQLVTCFTTLYSIGHGCKPQPHKSSRFHTNVDAIFKSVSYSIFGSGGATPGGTPRRLDYMEKKWCCHDESKWRLHTKCRRDIQIGFKFNFVSVAAAQEGHPRRIDYMESRWYCWDDSACHLASL